MSSRSASSTSRVVGSSPRQRRKQRRLTEILEAAFEEFTQRGYTATRLEDVGERVSLTKGAIYFYFKDKEDLFRAVVLSVIQPTIRNIVALAEHFEGPTEELIRLLMTTFYREVVRDRKRSRLIRLLIAEGPNFPELTEFFYNELLQHGIGSLKLAIQRGVDRGEFRPGLVGDYPQIIMAPAVVAVIWMLLFGKSHPLDLERYFQAHCELVMNGLKVRPDSNVV
ncbi:MAG TPA: TetR/AcrR family transcriptional regulator [Candidatus Binataceae bacterium]|nr:TetR/AcrR family transcriptional regulator [Candidatus Binataceae bacterium]